MDKYLHKKWFQNVFWSCILFLVVTHMQGQKFSPHSGLQKHFHVASSTSEIEMSISYNEKILFDPYMVTEWENSSWTIQGEDEFFISGQNFEDLRNYIFTIPGAYVVELQINPPNGNPPGNQCTHICFPPRIVLDVKKYKLTFLPESILFSDTILSGVETNGMFLTMDLLFESYDGSTMVFQEMFQTAGIQTSIVGVFPNPVTLTPGVNQIIYPLSGKVMSSNTYISFDFINPVNGLSWSYPLMNAIL